MAKPTSFPQSNHVWHGWKDRPGQPDVDDLPSFRDGNETISCWRLSWLERLAILFTGRAWLYVIGHQPPVCIEGRNPWRQPLVRFRKAVTPEA